MVFSVTEVLSLFLSQQLLAPLAGTQLGDGLTAVLGKIKNLMPEKALRYFATLDGSLIVKNTAGQDYSRHDKKIRIINQAIQEGRVVNLRYRSVSKKKPYDTRYHPYGMVFFESNLYCIGFMTEYEEIRTLKISRIISAELTGETFSRPGDFSLQAHIRGSFGIFSPGKPQTVTVRFSDWAATMVREQKWHHTQRITEEAGNCVVAQFELSDTTEFKRWILGFGHCAVVERPRSLADAVTKELSVTASMYKL